MAGIFSIVAFLMDICVLGIYGVYWHTLAHQFEFAVYMYAICMICKLGILMCLYFMLGTIGFHFPDVSAPVDNFAPTTDTANLNPGDTFDVPAYQDDNIL